MIWIGIDTGVNTGVAMWNEGAFRFIKTMQLHQALAYVHYTFDINDRKGVTVVFEDARLRKWYGTYTAKQDRDKLQGAGSVKRDCKIWEEALCDWGIPFVRLAPKNNLTKLSAEQFQRITGWKGKTNEHGRDAAMLVFGR